MCALKSECLENDFDYHRGQWCSKRRIISYLCVCSHVASNIHFKPSNNVSAIYNNESNQNHLHDFTPATTWRSCREHTWKAPVGLVTPPPVGGAAGSTRATLQASPLLNPYLLRTSSPTSSLQATQSLALRLFVLEQVGCLSGPLYYHIPQRLDLMHSQRSDIAAGSHRPLPSTNKRPY